MSQDPTQMPITFEQNEEELVERAKVFLVERRPPPIPDFTQYMPKRKRYGNFSAPRVGPKINRNQGCPCGSGRKYKKCCLNRNRTNE
ncbi:MAG: SEC-C domain-containing protein [Acinetobacter sp.]|nr:SEC-C domain-containing protein [Acinetobacter sp.]